MTHIFISYNREDKKIRERLTNFLVEHGFDEKREIWFDEVGIKGGAEWGEIIDEALREAYALVVILTQKALESIYVTYEWSCALALGIPVIPLACENNLKVPPPLGRKQYIACDNGEFPPQIESILKQYQEVSSLTISTARAIFQQFIPLMIYIRICLWMNEKRPYHPNDYAYISGLINNEIMQLTQKKLPEFWLNHSHAFTTGQKKRIKELNKACEIIFELVTNLGTTIHQPTQEKRELIFKTLKNSLQLFYQTEMPRGQDAFGDYEIIAEYFAIEGDIFPIVWGDPFLKPNTTFTNARVYKTIQQYIIQEQLDLITKIVMEFQNQ